MSPTARQIAAAHSNLVANTEPVELPEDEPWLKLPQETNQAYDAFTIYREMGAERSKLAAERVYRERKGQVIPQKLSAQFQVYAKKFSWAKRVELYERWSSEQDMAVIRQKRAKTLRKQAEEMEKVTEMLMAPIEPFRERLEQLIAGKAVEDLDMNDIITLGKATAQAIAQAHKNQRDILGLSDVTDAAPTNDVDLQLRAEAVRAAIANPDTIAALEKFTVDVGVRVREATAPKLSPSPDISDNSKSPVIDAEVVEEGEIVEERPAS